MPASLTMGNPPPNMGNLLPPNMGMPNMGMPNMGMPNMGMISQKMKVGPQSISKDQIMNH